MRSLLREELYKNSNENDIPLPLSGHRVVCDPQGNGLYLVGGWNPSFRDDFDGDPNNFDLSYVRQVWKYNFARKSWTRLKSEQAPMSLASHSMTFVGSHYLLIYGGSLSTKGILGNSNDTYLYDVNQETWQKLTTSGSPCPELCGHWFGQAMAKSDDHILAATGFLSGLHSAGGVKINKLDLRTLTWYDLTGDQSGSRDQHVPDARVRHEIVVYDQKLYVIGGGRNFRDSCYSLQSIPCFDLKSETWTSLRTSPDSSGAWPMPRQCHTACLSGGNGNGYGNTGCGTGTGTVYITGGYSDYPSDDNENWTVVQTLDDCWQLNLHTLKWTLLPYRLPKSLWFHAGDVSRQTEMYIFGGCTDLDYQERSNKMYKIDLENVTSLENLCWDSVLKSYRNFFDNECDDDFRSLLDFGLPNDYVNKLRW